MAKSEGIHRDIDLTKNKIFQHGAKDLLDLTDLNPGETIWSPGFILKFKEPSKLTLEEVLKQYFPDNNWISRNINKSLAINSISAAEFESSPIYNIVSKMPEDSDVDDVIEMLVKLNNICDLVVKPDGIFIELDPYNMYRDDYNYINYDVSIAIDNYTYNSYKCENNYVSILLDIYCPAIPNVKLTKDEYNGTALITGMSDTIYLKNRKRAILLGLTERLSKDSGRWKSETHTDSTNNGDMYICKTRGKQYKSLSKIGGIYSKCPECKIEEYFTQNKGFTDIDKLCTDRRFGFLRVRFTDFYSDILNACASYDLSQDQSYGYNYREDKTIDYFMQPVYEDNGLHLIRRKRNSHELVITLKDEEYDEDKDIPAVSFKPKKVLPCDDIGINNWLSRFA